MNTRGLSLRRWTIYAPLVLHVVPALVIGWVFVLPRSCIAGVNTLSLGFVATVVGFIPTYLAGVALARHPGG